MKFRKKIDIVAKKHITLSVLMAFFLIIGSLLVTVNPMEQLILEKDNSGKITTSGEPKLDTDIIEPTNSYDFASLTRPTRDGVDVSDFDLKWLDGYGTIIGYLNSIKSADVDNDDEIEVVLGNSEGYVYVMGYSQDGFTEEWNTMVGMYAIGLSLDDMDSDGTIEIVVGNRDGFINIYGFDGTTYVLEWTSPDLGSDLYGLTTADVDDDGTIEIIAGSSVTDLLEDNIFVYSRQGSTYVEEWSYALTTTLGYLGLFNVAVGDVDGDDEKEIVFASYENEMLQNDPPVNPIPPNPRPTSTHGGRFYVFGYTHGSGEPEWQSDDFGEWIIGMDIGNTDSDVNLEIVIALYFGEIHIYHYFNLAYRSEWVSEGLSSYALSVGKVDDMLYDSILMGSWYNTSVLQYSAGSYQQIYRSPRLDSVIYGIGCGDIDNDGFIKEILTGTFYKFYAHGFDGSTFVMKAESDNLGAIESMSSGDLDGDGAREIFMGTESGNVMIFAFNGVSMEEEDTISLSTRDITHMACADVDDDGNEEIIAVEGHTSITWNENFVFRGASGDSVVYIIEYGASDYHVGSQIDVDVGAVFCAEVGDVDDDGVPEILLGGTGYDEVNEDPFVGQIEIIDHDIAGYSVVWESYYFDNWVMGVAIGDVDGDGENEMATEDYDSDLDSNVLRLFEYNGFTYVELQPIQIESENYALDIGDPDSDSGQEIVSKGIFSGLLQVFGRSGSSYTQEWSTGQYTTFIDECIAVTNLNEDEEDLLIFGELGVFIYEYSAGNYQEIWHSDEIPASIKNIHLADVDVYPGKDIIGSSGGYNFIYGEAPYPIAVLSVSDSSVNMGENVAFDGSLSFGKGDLEYFFDLGDGTTSGWQSTPTVSHAYSSARTFTATLTVRDEDKTQSPDLASVTVTVSFVGDKPIAFIDSITPNPASEGTIVSFLGHGEYDKEIAANEWKSSKDGFLADTPSFNYSSLSLGSHDISFRVMGEDGIWSDETFSSIRINQIPTARIDSISPTSPNVGESITFTGSGSDDGTIAGYSWRSSIDGFLSSQASFSRSSLSPGAHVIYLKVVDDDDFWSEEVSRGLSVNQIPEALIESISPDPALIGELVFFEGTGNDDGSITAYNWESDIDGFLSSKSTFSISSLSVGLHMISFKVRDNKGIWSESDNRSLSVISAPENMIPTAFIDSASPSKIKQGDEVMFIGHGTDEDGEITEYYWESDIDGLLSDERTFKTTDLSSGTHVISFRVRDDRGDWSEPVQTQIEVEETEEMGLLDLILNPEENPETFFLFF
ncbi:MAG: PKD domain-containing protein, partial [Methanomassiliicoccales archaeon]